MTIDKVKQLILKSVGQQKEFKIIEGPAHGMLGVLIFDGAPQVLAVGMSVLFRVLIENELGQAAVCYGILPENINNHPKGKIDIKNGYIVFRGKVMEIPDDESPIKEEKHKLIAVGTDVDIIFNDETCDGSIRFLDTKSEYEDKLVEQKSTEASPEKVEPKTTEEILQKKVEDFRSNYNKDTHDWIFTESTLILGNLIFAAFCREYAVHSDQNAYSMVYVFSKDKDKGDRIYYAKFWDSCPEWRDPKQFIKTLKSAKKNKKAIEISAEAEDGSEQTLIYTIE